MKKAVIYARYSSERQTEQSIEGQIRDCRSFAEAEGIEIIGEYIDRAISGTTDNRPDFQRMIADSRHGDFEAVIVYKLDRFARNRYDSAVYKSKLKKNGVKVLSAKEHITDTPEGIIVEGLLESMNEYYSAELSQKVKRGMRENVLKSKTTGGNIALGYKVGSDKRFEIDEAGAALVRRIFDSYDNGKTFAEICTSLNAAGYKTSRGKEYRSSTITRILSNRKYIGEYAAKGIDAVSTCPAIIAPEQFDRVQKRLSEHLQKHRHRNPAHSYILTGKITCPVCEKSMSGISGKSHTGNYYYYYKCGCRKIPAPDLEETVIHAITQYLTSDNCKGIAEKAYQLYQKERKENPELQAARKALKNVTQRLDNAVEAVLSGLSSNAVRDAISDLESRKTVLEGEVRRLSAGMPDLKPEHFAYFLQQFKKFQKTDQDKQHIIDTIVNRVIVYPERIVILINVTDTTKTPPLQQITAALEGSCNIAIGGGEGNRTPVRKPVPATFYECSLPFKIPC